MSVSRLAMLALLAAQAAWGHAPTRADDSGVRCIAPVGPPGTCSVTQWRSAWPGCAYEDGVSERRLSVVQDGDDLGFRIDYALGEIGPDRGGVGWRYPIGGRDAVELSYDVTFGGGFDWARGGKLPGLCGGPESVSGGRRADGRNGFSVRLMWRAEGRGEAYVYHMNQRGTYGDSFAFPADFRFPTGTPVTVRLRVSINTPARRDGTLDVWIRRPGVVGEDHVVRRSDMEWRSDPSLTIDGLLFETFHGGSDRDWAPRRPSWTTFSRITIRSLPRPE